MTDFNSNSETPPQEYHDTTPPNTGSTGPQPSVVDPNITSEDRLWAMLAYLLTPIVPVIILLIEEKRERPFLKAHTVQALIWGIVVWLASTLLSGFFFIGCVIGIAALVFSVMWALKANKGEYINIPVITDLVKSQGWN